MNLNYKRLFIYTLVWAVISLFLAYWGSSSIEKRVLAWFMSTVLCTAVTYLLFPGNRKEGVADIIFDKVFASFQQKRQKEALDDLKEISGQVRDIHANTVEMMQKNLGVENTRQDIFKKQAEVNLLNAKTSAEWAKADLMRKAVDNFDTLPQSLQVYVMRAVFNPGDKQEDDILLQEQVREYLKMEKESAAKKSEYEAQKMKAEADVASATAQDTIKKMK